MTIHPADDSVGHTAFTREYDASPSPCLPAVTTALDDVEFLASSPNRVAVLHTLAVGPRSRSDLHDVTGISQPTLGRVLDGFTDRGWVEKVGREFHLTRVGALVATAFDQLLARMTTGQRLAALEELLPLDDLPFDIEAFADATITTPRRPDVLAHIRRVESLVVGARRVRWLTGNVFFETVAQQRALLLETGQHQEVVMASDALDVLLSQPRLAATVADLVGSEALSLYSFGGTVPFALGLADDRAVVVPYDEQSVPCAVVDSDDETVVAWVESTIDAYRDRSVPVTAASLAG